MNNTFAGSIDTVTSPAEAATSFVTTIPRQLTRRQRLIKRGFDLALVIPGLVLLLPVFLLVGLAVWLDSGSPIFFRQRRVGEGGHLFWIFKFRTMVADAEARVAELHADGVSGAAVAKLADDPRVTRIGQLLRRSSLDELPQLLNVLRGDMSLVGPRPELTRLAATYHPWQWERFSVPPGLTCLWQIRGRSTRGVVQKSLDDLEYIRNYSFWLDVQILLATIHVVLEGKGAY